MIQQQLGTLVAWASPHHLDSTRVCVLTALLTPACQQTPASDHSQRRTKQQTVNMRLAEVSINAHQSIISYYFLVSYDDQLKDFFVLNSG